MGEGSSTNFQDIKIFRDAHFYFIFFTLLHPSIKIFSNSSTEHNTHKSI